jgi:phosphatidate cytidylyltransferase
VTDAQLIGRLLVAVLVAWLAGLALTEALRRHSALSGRLRAVRGLMVWQLLMAFAVAGFVLAPVPVQWLIFFLAATRMGVELARLPGRWTPLRLGAACLSPVVPMGLLAVHVGQPAAALPLFLAYFLTELFDGLSYLGGHVAGGRLFGGRRPVPRLSPGKTWEGYLTGAAAVLLAGMGLIASGLVDPLPMLVAALVTCLGAPLGDLAASAGKRLAGVKDYPTLLRDQGGLIDILDSWIWTAPVMAFALARLG